VDKPEDYLYSSARSYVHAGQPGLLEVLKIWTYMAAFGKLVLSPRLRTTLEMFLLVEHSGERGFLVSIFRRLEHLPAGLPAEGMVGRLRRTGEHYGERRESIPFPDSKELATAVFWFFFTYSEDGKEPSECKVVHLQLCWHCTNSFILEKKLWDIK
jgi:hypothetical protein